MRYEYTSLTTPMTVYDYDIQTGERQLMKRTPVLGGFDSANYRTELVWAPARDGAKVPVSLVYRTGIPQGRHRAAAAVRLRLLRRHHGPGVLDRARVAARPRLRRTRSRTSAAARRWAVAGTRTAGCSTRRTPSPTSSTSRASWSQEGYADGKRVSAMGGSAGGLLMGAVANMAPADYRAIVAQVPFVDVVTTMLDESIPLTTNEFDEWGNPKKKEYYDYMLSYSPYDNVARQAYPAMLVTTGLRDSQVQYWEPAKWVARLRARKTDANPLAVPHHDGGRARRQVGTLPALPRDRRGVRLHPRPVGHPRVSVSLGRIEQVAIPVRDLARATAFYRDRLGMKLLFEVPSQLAFFDCDGIRLALSIFFRPDVRPAGLDRLLPRGRHRGGARRARAP